MSRAHYNRLKLWVHITAEERDAILEKLVPADEGEEPAVTLDVAGLRLAARIDVAQLALPHEDLRREFAARLEILAMIEDERL